MTQTKINSTWVCNCAIVFFVYLPDVLYTCYLHFVVDTASS
jgi:hypothetical protein